jgi:hypothetical protein
MAAGARLLMKDFLESMPELDIPERLAGITVSADGETVKGGGGHVIKGALLLPSPSPLPLSPFSFLIFLPGTFFGTAVAIKIPHYVDSEWAREVQTVLKCSSRAGPPKYSQGHHRGPNKTYTWCVVG